MDTGKHRTVERDAETTSQEMPDAGGHRGGRPESDVPPRDDVFSALSNERRRYVLEYLLEQDEPVGIRELSRHVAAKENGVPVEDVTHDQRKRVYIALHQNHLPQLGDMGFVDNGRASEAIELTDRASVLDAYLDPEPGGSRAWSSVEVGLTVAGALLVALGWFDPYPFASVPDILYAAALVAALAVVTVARYYRNRTG
jgi:hypothetical protein